MSANLEPARGDLARIQQLRSSLQCVVLTVDAFDGCSVRAVGTPVRRAGRHSVAGVAVTVEEARVDRQGRQISGGLTHTARHQVLLRLHGYSLGYE